MAPRRTTPPSAQPSAAPADAREGAAHLQEFLVYLFDRKDGTGADWGLMVESVFRAGFAVSDAHLPEQQRRAVMQRVYIGAYDRAAGNGEERREQPPQGKGRSSGSKGSTSRRQAPRPPL